MAEEAATAYMKAMFEDDNKIRRIEDDGSFRGSVWDRDWEHLQPYVQDLYRRAMDRDLALGRPVRVELRPQFDALIAASTPPPPGVAAGAGGGES